MSLAPSRRALAALTVATTLSLSMPGIAQALPSPDREEPRGFLQQILAGPAGWVQSFLILWEANGSGLDPDGAPTNQADPTAGQADSDAGSSLDPSGRT